MTTFAARLKKSEFEARIFVSLSIVAAVTVPSLVLFRDVPAIIVLAGSLIGLDAGTAQSAGFGTVGAVLACCTILRMWAGSLLTPERVMAFRVQVDALDTRGPYRLVRNPIYLADFVAMCSFALCLPPSGLVMPILFYLHYTRIIQYEEISLAARFNEAYAAYADQVPRLLPRLRHGGHLPLALREFGFNAHGVRHNALYVLFIPGFCVAAVTHDFLHAVLIGLPGVFDWAIIHTVIGTRHRT